MANGDNDGVEGDGQVHVHGPDCDHEELSLVPLLVTIAVVGAVVLAILRRCRRSG